MSDSLMIETKGMTKEFGKFVAVDGIDLRIERGAVHGFIGPNGAGKTTTIKMLIGAIRCTRGSGYIMGQPVGSVAAKRLIGYSPEHPAFYREMSALDYLVYMARVCGVAGDVERKAIDLLDWLELGKFTESKVGGFSAGMKQRLGLAQALIHDPELLILDEPTANLDPTGRMSILGKLRETSKERGVTIFISSHILGELEHLVDSVTLINKGRVVAEDSMQNLKEAYSKDRYVLKTSDNGAVLDAIKARTRSLISDSWIDEGGFIHLVSQDGVSLKRQVVEVIRERGALLDHFSQEEVTLETIYRRKMGLEAE
ncbi:MAG: ABC transporter ATP-binding protein [Chloroflexi bacterium]|nr:MAG: ABC transporter ATP-binding protein [Chloroflexota bacterium]